MENNKKRAHTKGVWHQGTRMVILEANCLPTSHHDGVVKLVSKIAVCKMASFVINAS